MFPQGSKANIQKVKDLCVLSNTRRFFRWYGLGGLSRIFVICIHKHRQSHGHGDTEDNAKAAGKPLHNSNAYIVGVNNNTKNDTTLRIRISLTRMLGFCEAFFTIGISSSFYVKPSNYTLFLKKDDIKTSNLLNYRKFTLVFKKIYYVN